MRQYIAELEASDKFEANVYERKAAVKSGNTIKEEETEDYKYIQIIPPPKKEPKQTDLVKIADLPKYCQQAFGYTKQLNQIQSIVFPVAFRQSRSMIVAAPTGAGKTNVALLAILR
jgi:pre-mRNA-splicing helicase BRR2